MERNRSNTEQKILSVAKEIIDNEGFEALNITKVAKKAGVSKVLIYRYFESLGGLVMRVIEDNDFWTQIPDMIEPHGSIVEQMKDMCHRMALVFRDNPIVRKFYRWEMTVDNELTRNIRSTREALASREFARCCDELGIDKTKSEMFGTVIKNAIVFTVMMIDSPRKNTPDICSEEGWNAFLQCIDDMIEGWTGYNSPKK